ncbi:chondroitin sulfate synthase sqv-5 X2 [Biomphalaria glabrata]|nr:chondroitin sulfate synthase sqv-5 X2 [Biomphalaria glabrata]
MRSISRLPEAGTVISSSSRLKEAVQDIVTSCRPKYSKSYRHSSLKRKKKDFVFFRILKCLHYVDLYIHRFETDVSMSTNNINELYECGKNISPRRNLASEMKNQTCRQYIRIDCCCFIIDTGSQDALTFCN